MKSQLSLASHLEAELAVLSPANVETFAVSSWLEYYVQSVCCVANANCVPPSVELRYVIMVAHRHDSLLGKRQPLTCGGGHQQHLRASSRRTFRRLDTRMA